MTKIRGKKAAAKTLPGQLDLFSTRPPNSALLSAGSAPQVKPKMARGVQPAKGSQSKNSAPPVNDRTQDDVELLDTRQAARRLKLGVSTLEKMRKDGRGPRFLKLTNAAVRYHPRDLENWIETRIGDERNSG